MGLSPKEFEFRKRIVEDRDFRMALATNTSETLEANGLTITPDDIQGLDLDFDFSNLSENEFKKKLEQEMKCIGVNTIIICTFKQANENLQ